MKVAPPERGSVWRSKASGVVRRVIDVWYVRGDCEVMYVKRTQKGWGATRTCRCSTWSKWVKYAVRVQGAHLKVPL